MKEENVLWGLLGIGAGLLLAKGGVPGIGATKILSPEAEIKKAKEALSNLPENHALAPQSFKDEIRMFQGGRKAGQSYNAMYAEQRGEVTKSKLPAVLKRIVDAGYAHSTMWHHTGMFKGYMNETLFYAANDFDLEGYEHYLKNKDSVDTQRSAEAMKKADEQARREQRINELEQIKSAWLKEHADYVVRTPTNDLFITDKREMNGKYGWFDSSGKSYNMPEYFTGWRLKPGLNYREAIESYYALSAPVISGYY